MRTSHEQGMEETIGVQSWSIGVRWMAVPDSEVSTEGFFPAEVKGVQLPA
jgi:hypothetical protein